MLPIPSAIDKAKQLIKDNPKLFQDNLQTQIAISQAIIEHCEEMSQWLRDLQTINDYKIDES